jgi:glycosyltransferase A (GT-A) superfamily protein (DUF2064 family)
MFATVPPPPQRLLVFARLPELGKVKTRLAADVGEERALAIYRAMLRDLIANIGDSTPDTEIEFLWPPTPHANGDALRAAFGPHPTAMQTGPGLGDRLSMALSERFFFHRTDKIVVIGADDPTLTRELIDHAFALLDSCEYVLGPATDGGYYLFDATLQRIAAMQRTVALLPERYDIDTGADLQRYGKEGHDGELGKVLRTMKDEG